MEVPLKKNSSNKENETSVATSVVTNEIVDVCSNVQQQHTRSGRVIHRNISVNYDYELGALLQKNTFIVEQSANRYITEC